MSKKRPSVPQLQTLSRGDHRGQGGSLHGWIGANQWSSRRQRDILVRDGWATEGDDADRIWLTGKAVAALDEWYRTDPSAWTWAPASVRAEIRMERSREAS